MAKTSTSPRPAPPKRSRSSSDEVRERLLNSAELLFSSRGIQAVGVDEVCEHAGVAKMSLYKHFKCKDQLIAAYLERKNAAFLASVRQAIDAAPGGAHARVLAIFDFLGAWFASPEFRGCPFLNAAAEIADSQHPARSVCREHKERFQALLGEQAAQLGRADTELLAEQLMLLVDGAVLRAQISGTSLPAKTAKEAAARLLG